MKTIGHFQKSKFLLELPPTRRTIKNICINERISYNYVPFPWTYFHLSVRYVAGAVNPYYYIACVNLFFAEEQAKIHHNKVTIQGTPIYFRGNQMSDGSLCMGEAIIHENLNQLFNQFIDNFFSRPFLYPTVSTKSDIYAVKKDDHFPFHAWSSDQFHWTNSTQLITFKFSEINPDFSEPISS